MLNNVMVEMSIEEAREVISEYQITHLEEVFKASLYRGAEELYLSLAKCACGLIRKLTIQEIEDELDMIDQLDWDNSEEFRNIISRCIDIPGIIKHYTDEHDSIGISERLLSLTRVENVSDILELIKSIDIEYCDYTWNTVFENMKVYDKLCHYDNTDELSELLDRLIKMTNSARFDGEPHLQLDAWYIHIDWLLNYE